MGESAGNTGQSTAASNSGEGSVNNVSNESTASAEAVSTETGSEEVTNNEEKPDYRTKFRQRFGEGIEGWDPDNNDLFYAEADKQFEGLTKYKNDNVAINKKMIDTLQSNPEAAGLFRDIMKGAPLNVAIARNVDVDSIKPLEGDPDMDSWKEGLTERQKRLAEKEAYNKEVQENYDFTVKEIKAFGEENNLEPEAAVEFIGKVENVLMEAMKGKITKKTLSNLYRAMNADTEVADAAEKAKVEALNTKIEAVKEVDNVERTGDGVPRVMATNKEQVEDNTPKDAWTQAIEYQRNKKKI